jgi:hypothetical protein
MPENAESTAGIASPIREGWAGSRQTILLTRGTRTIRKCSFDARSEGQSGDSPYGKVGKIRRPSPWLMARLGVPVGGRVRSCAQWEIKQDTLP